jgi:hypothetical protein
MKKGKSCGCGHEKMERKGKEKGLIAIAIKLSPPKKKAKRK